MDGFRVTLRAAAFSAALASGVSALAQDSFTGLPLGTAALDPIRDPAMIEEVRTAAAAGLDDSSSTLDVMRSLSPVPTAKVPAAANGRFSPMRRVAQIRRGKQVFEISNEAFRASGVLEHAVESTPELARAYHNLEASTHQLQAVQSQQAIGLDGVSAQAMDRAVTSARATQQATAQAFEDTLWSTGFNGAKVASVTNTTTARRSHKQYVLLDAISNSSNDNLGYSVTRISRTGDFGVTTVPSEYLLPVPVDPNDVFFSPLFSAQTQRMPDGVMLMLSDDATTNPIIQALALPRVGFLHDTGVVGRGDTTFAERVSLQSRRDPAAGQTQFLQGAGEGMVNDFDLPLDLAFNSEILDIGAGTTGQLFVTANNDADLQNLDIEALGFRAYMRRSGSLFEGWSLVGGRKQSLFGAVELRPQGLDGNRSLVGTIDSPDNRVQLAVHAPLNNYWTLRVGLENPDDDDFVFTPAATNNVTSLTRWPTLASNLTWKDPINDDQIVLGSLVRTLGYQVNATGREEFTTGWGLSATGKVSWNDATYFAGTAGGSGLGNYVRGISGSILGDLTSVQTLDAVGAFVGQTRVFRNQCNDPIAELNLVYGYSHMETPNAIAATTNGKVHHFWANYLRFIGDRVGLGMEYQYGHREVASGDVGENHRVTFLLAVRSSAVQRSTLVREMNIEDALASASTPVTGEGGLDADLGSGGLDDDLNPSAASMESAEVQGLFSDSPFAATLDGRGVQSVVRQRQLGGAAFRQSL